MVLSIILITLCIKDNYNRQEQNNCDPYARVTSFAQETNLGFCYRETHSGTRCTARFCRYQDTNYFPIVQAVHYIIDIYRRNRVEVNYDHNTYRHFRLQYLLKQIDEKQFKHNLSASQSRQIKHRKIYEVYQMFFTVGRDQFQILFRDKDMQTFVTSMQNLRVYCLDALKKIYSDYTDSSFQFFDERFSYTRIYV
jgi:hypothetical protein